MSTKVQKKWAISPQEDLHLCVFKFISEHIAVPDYYIAENLGVPVARVTESLEKLRPLLSSQMENDDVVWSVCGTPSVYDYDNEFSDPMRIVAYLHSNFSGSASQLDSIAFRSEEDIHGLITRLSPLVVQNGGTHWDEGEITPTYVLNESVRIRMAS